MKGNMPRNIKVTKHGDGRVSLKNDIWLTDETENTWDEWAIQVEEGWRRYRKTYNGVFAQWIGHNCCMDLRPSAIARLLGNVR